MLIYMLFKLSIFCIILAFYNSYVLACKLRTMYAFVSLLAFEFDYVLFPWQSKAETFKHKKIQLNSFLLYMIQ